MLYITITLLLYVIYIANCSGLKSALSFLKEPLINIFVFLITSFFTVKYFQAISKYYDLIYEVAETLTFYANRYANPNNIDNYSNTAEKTREEAAADTRRTASRLRAYAAAINIGPFARCLAKIPSHKNIDLAASLMFGLSNSICTPLSNIDDIINMNMENIDKINEALNIKALTVQKIDDESKNEGKDKTDYTGNGFLHKAVAWRRRTNLSQNPQKKPEHTRRKN